MNNFNIYVSLVLFVIAMVVSNIFVYNIGIKNGKCMYKDMLIDKRREGIKRRSIEGKCFKPLPDNHTDIIAKWVNGEITSKQASIELEIGTTTLYRRFGHLRKK